MLRWFGMERSEAMDHTQEYFDRVADKWDDMRRTFFGEGVRVAAVAGSLK